MNVRKRFLSSDDNFVIFGANCSESCLAVERYITKLVSDVAYLESKALTVDGKTVNFEFAEIPNDTKMLSFLGGELRNSAKYFSSFGNVTYDDENLGSLLLCIYQSFLTSRETVKFVKKQQRRK